MSVKSEKVTFTGAGGDTLAARLDLPRGRPRAYALFAHCFTCNKDIFAAARIAGALAAQGIAVLRFDFTGLGASEGDFANTNFSSNIADLLCAADYLRRSHEAPKLLIGHSLGGAAVLMAAAQVPEAVAVATIAAPADPAHVTAHFTEARPEIEAAGEAEVLLVGRPFRIKKQFLEDIEQHKLERTIGGLRKALMVFHAPRDATVGIDNASRIFLAAKHPKSFVSLDDADHLLSRKADAIYVADVLAAWAERYLGAGKAAPDLQAAEGRVVVEETGEGKFTQRIAAGPHQLRADEPESYGGLDSGPSPYDLLLAGLGACTSMTLRLYAERKGLALDRTRVTLSHDKIHAEDCETCETRSGRIDRIQRNIEITGQLSPEERQRLLEIADKCPVHRTLESEILIETKAGGQNG
ncbi:bifunctional alpha/beta hydrolase/OsmC family protein [Pelagibius marinus]|uniref:bifunctional alpha/beta hydrolase/OsmC family protein n=1 Tax=Pelagibius marinus TaxID=2762760 RepID=UPI001D055636|nr:alpha/beta fold hydrolase [Pelagibius marinus]